MTEFPRNIEFKFPWRKYQQRVLDELQNHLNDDHLHVIAPPGSGKTVLGLEVAIRLNKPTLILAPTIAIRNQWIQRFCELFLQTTLNPDWISIDIRKPSFLTVVTYQGLHAACNSWESEVELLYEEETDDDDDSDSTQNHEIDRIVDGLKYIGVKTVVMDEAHHLKKAWWFTLTQIKEKLQPTIVGLTATPPYDVSPLEWQRYINLNGPVDAEISVPELIIEGNLCPHQDYVHFTYPTEKEKEKIVKFRENIEKLFQSLKNDETIIEAIVQHPIWQDPTGNLEWIYNNLYYYSACLIFLKSNNVEIPETHLEVIGDKNFVIPDLDYSWFEMLLDFYLYKDKKQFIEFDEHRTSLENRLRRYGAIERRKISFSYNHGVTRHLTTSISKLDGIKKIVDFEYRHLKDDLRMVILSDYIRKEFLVKSTENNLELNKIGIIPIFEKLRRSNTENKKIAVLTGSVIIIPTTAFDEFKTRAKKHGISHINSSPVPYDPDFLIIKSTGQLKHKIVNLITQIFQSGEIEVLIGTKSLLGEGWDAPAINSLIMASFVGSYVLSNQMRGRAIRTQIGNEDKTGNVWHLACIDPTSRTGGEDFELLKRRFRSFVGVSFREEPGIENGIERLNLSGSFRHIEEVEKMNEKMFFYASDRESLKQRWKTALETGVTLVEEIKIPFLEENEYSTVKSMYLYKTIGNLIVTLSSAVATFGLDGLSGLIRNFKNFKTAQDVYMYLAMLGIMGMIIFGRQTFLTFRLYLKYRDISKDIRKIGESLLKSLLKSGIISTEASHLKFKASANRDGTVFCHLDGGSTFEKSTFINALQEIVSPIDNPRYVIIRKSLLAALFKQKDYHSVPEILGRNRDLAEIFKKEWELSVGSCELVFTRSLQGRKLLLQSRVRSLASQFEGEIEHVNIWK